MVDIDIEAAVVADLKLLATIAPAPVHYVDEAPNDDQIPTVNGLVVPYIVVHPGSPKSSRVGRTLTGVRDDMVENYLMVEVTAPNYVIAKQIGTALNDHLFGKVYAGATELVLDVAVGGKETVEERIVPTVYKYGLIYDYKTNL